MARKRAPDILPVGILEIAERAGVKTDTVQKWRARHDDFPAPRGVVGGDPWFDWADIERWIDNR